MLLRDVRDYVATLNVTTNDKCYCGRKPDKEDMTIGIYPLKSSRKPNIPIGGIKNSSYGIKSVSILVHWNKSITGTEEAAIKLLDSLLNTRNEPINEHNIMFIQTSSDEPIPLGTDDNGVFEYVIECLFYYERR